MLMFKLAWRSLWRHRRRTLITLSSIGIGTALALFSLSLAEGSYRRLVEDAVRMNAGHVTIEHREYRDSPSVDLFVSNIDELAQIAGRIPGVDKTKALILSQAVVSTGSGSAGVAITGVDPDSERDVSPLAKQIVEGRYLETSDERGVIVGRSLASRLKLAPGKKLVVTANDSHGELVSELLRVTGIYETGMEEADGFFIQVTLDAARMIFHLHPDQATQLGIVLSDPGDQERALVSLRQALTGRDLALLPWQEVLPDLSGFIAMDRGSNYVFQGILLFLIGFTILNTILMSVLERGREFATLLALGTPPWMLRLQVIVESALIGVLGVVSGLAVGGSISYYFHVYGLNLRGIYGEDTSVAGFAIDPLIHNEVTAVLLLSLAGLIAGSTLLIGLYPAFKSVRIPVADILRGH